jgi:hypothetical protein
VGAAKIRTWLDLEEGVDVLPPSLPPSIPPSLPPSLGQAKVKVSEVVVPVW